MLSFAELAARREIKAVEEKLPHHYFDTLSAPDLEQLRRRGIDKKLRKSYKLRGGHVTFWTNRFPDKLCETLRIEFFSNSWRDFSFEKIYIRSRPLPTVVQWDVLGGAAGGRTMIGAGAKSAVQENGGGTSSESASGGDKGAVGAGKKNDVVKRDDKSAAKKGGNAAPSADYAGKVVGGGAGAVVEAQTFPAKKISEGDLSPAEREKRFQEQLRCRRAKQSSEKGEEVRLNFFVDTYPLRPVVIFFIVLFLSSKREQ